MPVAEAAGEIAAEVEAEIPERVGDVTESEEEGELNINVAASS